MGAVKPTRQSGALPTIARPDQRPCCTRTAATCFGYWHVWKKREAGVERRRPQLDGRGDGTSSAHNATVMARKNCNAPRARGTLNVFELYISRA